MRATQMGLFETTYEPYRISKPIRLIELFAGIGAQAKAFEWLKADFESHRVVEWSCKSVIGYNTIHVGDWEDYSNGVSYDTLLKRVSGVSMDYNQPMSEEQLKRKGEKWLRGLYSSMRAIKDYYPDVSAVKGSDLGIERERESVLLRYDLLFPLPRPQFRWARERNAERNWHEEWAIMASGAHSSRIDPKARETRCVGYGERSSSVQ